MEDKYEVKINNYGTIYYKNGKLHRDNDLPAVEYKSGSKEWYKEGKIHRIDGPAIERYNGDKYWYYEDKLHRIDGPAYENSDENKKWYYEGKYVDCSSQEEFQRIINLQLFW